MQRRTEMEDSLATAEMLLSSGDAEPAAELLERLAADVEEYVSRNCPTTDELQWFAFPTIFERLAYRRVERDPRELRDVGEPLDRLYADLGHALVLTGDYAGATEALKQAVRWDPMDCGARLDLAELYRTNGQLDEFLALSFSALAPSGSPSSPRRVWARSSSIVSGSAGVPFTRASRSSSTGSGISSLRAQRSAAAASESRPVSR